MNDKIDRNNPASFNTPGREMLEDADVSQLGMAILTLTNEIWVLKDRIRVLEAVLEQKGIDVHESVENFQPDEALQQELSEEGKALAERVLSALSTKK